MRVMPNDLDIFMHVNNGVYLTYADLGRTDLLLRANAYGKIRKQGWYPVIAAETIRFKRSLTLGQHFTMTTHVLGWTERSIYLEQIFESDGQFVARAVIDARFLAKKGGVVIPAELLAVIGIDEPSPELPEWVNAWSEAIRD
jgi:YbgC/YbaW family acyl-CoA thioester hydrolase